VEREGKWLSTHNLSTVPSSPRLARRLSKSNRLLVLVELGVLAGIVKLRGRVCNTANRETGLSRLAAAGLGILFHSRVRGHVVHDDVHIRPDVQMAQLERALQRNCERRKGWPVVC
jgi:hypothetical protein